MFLYDCGIIGDFGIVFLLKGFIFASICATIIDKAEYLEQVSKDSIRKPVEAGAVPPL